MHALHIDRRDFLRRTAALGATLPFAVRGRAVFAAEPDLISRRLLFDNPDYVNVRISPMGSTSPTSRRSMACAISG
jgi:hypothetical protein